MDGDQSMPRTHAALTDRARVFGRRSRLNGVKDLKRCQVNFDEEVDHHKEIFHETGLLLLIFFLENTAALLDLVVFFLYDCFILS